MNIWLDDQTEGRRKAPHNFIHVRNLRELENLFARNPEPIEVMSFDHDLGEGEPTGYEIAKWMAEHHLERWPQTVEVHSTNPPGRANIVAFDEFVRNRLLKNTTA